MYRVIQNKIPPCVNGDIYLAEKYFYINIKFALLFQHMFLHKFV